jgi:hypothetical protein
MTSATTTPSRGARGRRAEGRGYGLVLFAAILLLVVGCFNLIDGIASSVLCRCWRRWGCWRLTNWPAGSR